MNDQVAVQKLLRRKLNELQARNPSFSVRAFAARLKLQPSATNEILKGERRVSRKLAERLAVSLHLDPSERAEFLKHFPLKRSKTAVTDRGSNIGSELSERDVLKLTSDQFSVISDWIHFAILNLTKLENAPQDYAAISERLGITETKATSAVDRLLRLGLLEKNSSGEWKRTFSRVNTPDDVIDVSVQKSHLADMELARESLLRDPIDRRDFSSLTVAIDPSLLPQAKEILRRAQDEVAALAAERPATEVYRLTSYAFPLSKSVKTRSSPSKTSRSIHEN